MKYVSRRVAMLSDRNPSKHRFPASYEFSGWTNSTSRTTVDGASVGRGFKSRHRLLSQNKRLELLRVLDWAIANLTPETARRLVVQIKACCKWVLKSDLKVPEIEVVLFLPRLYCHIFSHLRKNLNYLSWEF